MDWSGLLIGTNLGGLGTLIASMASLISYKQLAREFPEKKKRYFLWFTVCNVALLLLLLLYICVAPVVFSCLQRFFLRLTRHWEEKQA